ncbi:MAG TPA: hypothetical protein VIS07_10940 [Candidatus Binatia bacterium]
MSDLSWRPSEAEAVLRTMLSVAGVGGHRVPLPIERELVLAVQRHLLGTTLDVDALAPSPPSDLHEIVRDPLRLDRLVRCALLVPYVSLEAEVTKIAVVDALGIRLGIGAGVLRDLHRAREAHLRRVVLDHVRRGERLVLTVHSSPQVRALADGLRREPCDDALVARWRELRMLPVGTLGRTLHDLFRTRGLALPDEGGACDEALVRHDVLRVLGGYDLDPAGDLALAGFASGVAGVPRGDQTVLELLAEAHAGAQLRADPGSALACTGGGLEAALLAYERGVTVRAALGADWDPWSLASEDLGALRERCGLAEPSAARRTLHEDEPRPARVRAA